MCVRLHSTDISFRHLSACIFIIWWWSDRACLVCSGYARNPADAYTQLMCVIITLKKLIWKINCFPAAKSKENIEWMKSSSKTVPLRKKKQKRSTPTSKQKDLNKTIPKRRATVCLVEHMLKDLLTFSVRSGKTLLPTAQRLCDSVGGKLRWFSKGHGVKSRRGLQLLFQA